MSIEEMIDSIEQLMSQILGGIERAKEWLRCPNESCGMSPRDWIYQVGEAAFQELCDRAQVLLRGRALQVSCSGDPSN